MPDIKKRRIVIASVLKPVNDTRMTEKMAESLAATHQYEVHVIGLDARVNPIADVHFHRIAPFKRLSFSRLLAPWKILKLTRSINPALIIISSHELLIPALFLKVALKCKLVYDIQENYWRNILYTGAFPFLIRPFLAVFVRVTELLATPFVDHFFFAEKGYERELTFVGKRFTVLENKMKKNAAIRTRKRGSSNLLFSGTLAETTGVFKAIELADKLYAADPGIRLTIAGYCSQSSTLHKLQKAVAVRSHICLIGGDRLVAHHDIMSLIQEADAGIISYPENPSTINSIPTKLYEYLGCRLPILLTYHPAWTKVCMPYAAAVVYDPDNLEATAILNTLKTGHFYSQEPNEVFWDSEQPKLIRQILHLLS